VIAVDTSAIVAIILNEPERPAFLNILRDASPALISTVSAVETKTVVYGRRGDRAVVFVDDLLALPIFAITAPDVADMQAAYAAFVAFGKGSGHTAALNFGDVFAYALAKVRNLPLLFKGDDFAETDIRPAMTAP
jgi:ribonuclease VapC